MFVAFFYFCFLLKKRPAGQAGLRWTANHISINFRLRNKLLLITKCERAKNSACWPEISRPVSRDICRQICQPEATKPAAWLRFGGRDFCVATWLPADKVLSDWLIPTCAPYVLSFAPCWQIHKLIKKHGVCRNSSGVLLASEGTGLQEHQQLQSTYCTDLNEPHFYLTESKFCLTENINWTRNPFINIA
jgi:hypothetical protein